MTLIKNLEARRLRLHLATPYKLSFGAVQAFDTILVTLTCGGALGFGEATVLTGYTEETIEGSWSLAQELVTQLANAEVSQAQELLSQHIHEAPFTVTAFSTAFEMASGSPTLKSTTLRAIALLKILNATEENELEQEIEAAIAAEYSTVKVKVGFDVDADLKRLAFIQKTARGRLQLTVDANQGYDKADGCRFAAGIDPQSIVFLEQACHMHDWDAAQAVARVSTVPVMLDESIYNLADVRRVADLRCAQYVKVKLMKFGSIDALERGLEEIDQLGLTAVLGNGVATDIGCWMEACVASKLGLTTAGEMNGFLKPSHPIVLNPLKVEHGVLHVPPSYVPELDMLSVENQTIDFATTRSPMKNGSR